MKYTAHHTAITVRDLEKSIKFYSNFGFKQVHKYEEDDGSMSIVHLKLDNFFLELFYYPKNDNANALDLEYANNIDEIGVKHFAMQVDDVEAALSNLIEKGIADDSTKITVGKTKVEFFFVKDPDGVWVEVLKDERYS